MEKRGFISFWIKTGLFVFISSVLLGFQPHALISASVDIQKGEKPDLLQFTAGGHVLGFGNDRMYVAASDHMAGIAFVDARPVEPMAKRGASATAQPDNKTLPLEKVTYENLWNGVTLVYDHEEGAVFKSTYYISPSKAACVDENCEYPYKRIRLRYNVPVKVASNGALVLDLQNGQLMESAPIAWQEIEGNRVPVKASFRILSDREVGFQIDSYDTGFPLIIDPVLSWNTFMGSDVTDVGSGIAVDIGGNVYVTGTSDGTWGSPLTAHTGGKDAFVAKLNNSGVRLWNTFMGSTGVDNGWDIASSDKGDVYVTGGSYQSWGSPINPHAGKGEAFVAKLKATGGLGWMNLLLD